ncbi:alpha/beta hydrolase [Primorskyibacter aestuariivivens]|uniref:alpha/beta fold hydrolase n=1 Tax=Primorskyibacter aestuariivivens TaxID=1888912 RepID=UPI002301E8B2|nr:alpha/beta hydrolase [Primorskyibacter aestuariivivens]MDA7426995.1 alpha/beta hydrolase [Primorskyibacter aestuariivivens]
MLKTASAALLCVAALAGCGVVVDRRADLREAEAEARYGPVGQMLEVDGTTVHALVTGQGPDLVLLHGASGNVRDFTFDLVDRLKGNYRVIAFDRPGMGWTERLPGYGGAGSTRGETPREQARFLQKVADRLGVSNPMVLGHSYGGAVALAWALERPEDTAALVLLAAVSNPWPGSLDPLYRINSSALGSATVVPMITAFAGEERVDNALTAIFAPQPVPKGYDRHVGAGLSLRRESLRANAQQVNGLRPQVVEMSHHYGELTMPAEILHGTEDTIVGLSIHSEILATQMPNGTLLRMQGVGHMPHHADPEAVVAAVRRAARRAGLR